MIELTATNGQLLVMNSDLIERIESIPETKITLTNGKYLLVNDTKEEIVNKVIDYRRKINTLIHNVKY